jgi:precorrin-2/cobalt-factor-2 C20-methyltransferase
MSGKLYGIGVGPGDPELITVKALRILREAFVVAYPQPDDGPSFARSIVEHYLSTDQLEIAHHLDAGSDVVVLCEGDPFFYGSFMYLHERLAGRHAVEVVPGVSSMMAASAGTGRPLAARNDVLSVIPGPLENERIKAQIEQSDAVAIIKLGRHYGRVKALIEAMGLTDSSAFVERVSLQNEKLMPLKNAPDDAPYFSMILIYKGTEKWVLDLPQGTKF